MLPHHFLACGPGPVTDRTLPTPRALPTILVSDVTALGKQLKSFSKSQAGVEVDAPPRKPRRPWWPVSQGGRTLGRQRALSRRPPDPRGMRAETGPGEGGGTGPPGLDGAEGGGCWGLHRLDAQGGWEAWPAQVRAGVCKPSRHRGGGGLSLGGLFLLRVCIFLV